MALHHAVEEGDVARIDALFAEGASPNIQDLDGVTPLHRAARDGNFEMVKLLLQHRADPNISTHAGWDAVHLAAWKGHDGIVELLLSYKAFPNRRTPEQWNLIHLAARSGSIAVMDMALLDWGGTTGGSDKPDVNALDQSGRAPIHIAITHDNLAFAGHLLVLGADANVTDKAGNTALHLLPGKEGAEYLVGQLLVYGADIKRRNNQGQTPVDLASSAGDQKLLDAMWEQSTGNLR